jgi:drug/metabolite transporter (DMT)-like permease
VTQTSNLGGIAAMLAATATYVIGDSMMKLAAEDLPPFEVLFLRSVAASLACLVLIAARGEISAVPRVLDATTFLRAIAETLCTVFYVLALAHLPIADVVAMTQTAPLLVILGAAVFLRERMRPVRWVFVIAGFVGALLVAQPQAGGISIAAIYAFACAAGIAARDLLSRRVSTRIPVSAITLVTALMVLASSGLMSVAVEDWAPPTSRHLVYLGAAGALVTLGNAAIMLAYRIGQAPAVAPFFYSFAVWGVLSGVIVWGAWPNPLALAGIALIVGGGVALVLTDRARRREATALA